MRFTSLTRWRPLGLHPFTWLVGLVATTGLVLIEVPGVKYSSGNTPNTRQWREGGQHHKVFQWARRAGEPYKNTSMASFDYYDHGWPCYYMSRAIHLEEFREDGAQNIPSEPALVISRFNQRRQLNEDVPIGWSNFDSWPIRYSSWRLHYGYLAIDLAVVIALFVGAVGGTELWLRRRGGLLRFRILDMLLITTVSAAVVAWAESHRRFQKVEARITQWSHRQMSQPVILSTGYAGPHWLKLLIGNEKLLPTFHHTTTARLYIGTDWKADSAEVCKLRYLQTVLVMGTIPSAVVRDLSQLRDLEELDLCVLEPTGENYINFPSSLQEFLSQLGIDSEKELFGVKDLQLVTRLPLKELQLEGIPLAREDLAQIASMHSLRWLDISAHDVAATDVDWLRETYPQLEIEVSNGNW